MSDRIVHLARLSALAAVGRGGELRRAILRARRAGVPLSQIKELFLQSYLFAGFPRMINAFLTLASVPGSGGGAPSEGLLAPGRLRRRGEKHCRAVYGEQTDAMLARMREMHPDLAEWIVSEGYGKVLGRRWLGQRDRELASIPVLALQGVEAQLYSHLRGALRLGASRAQIRRALRACRGIVPGRRLDRAEKLLAGIAR
jgi:4-carboxymuconolactone decarboxylase